MFDDRNNARDRDQFAAAPINFAAHAHPTPTDREIARALAPYLRGNIFVSVGELPAILEAYRAEQLSRVRAA